MLTWLPTKFFEKAIPAILASLIMASNIGARDWHTYVQAILIGLGAGFGLDMGTYGLANYKAYKTNTKETPPE